MLNEHNARPEEVDAPVIAGDFLYGLLEARYGPAFYAEDLEKLVPKSLFFGSFASDACPFSGEVDGVVAYFVPTEWHYGRVEAGWSGVNLRMSQQILF